MNKLYIQTYGCQMNQYDSEKIAQVLARKDYVQTDRIDNADVILLNTCSVRDKAEQKVYSALGSWKEFKDYRDGVIIGVGGCVATSGGGGSFGEDRDPVSGRRNWYVAYARVNKIKDIKQAQALWQKMSLAVRIKWKKTDLKAWRKNREKKKK